MTKKSNRRKIAERILMMRMRRPKIKAASRKANELPTTLYFAYGSNLNHRQMKSRCPKAIPVAPLNLNNGLLTFRYWADIEFSESDNDVIAGGLWKITPECERTLDVYEGVRGRHYEKRYLLLAIDGVEHKCLYYRMIDPGVMPPDKDYLAGIRQGYKDFGLDLRLLRAAIVRSRKHKDKSETVMARWHRNGRKRLVKADAIPEPTVH